MTILDQIPAPTCAIPEPARRPTSLPVDGHAPGLATGRSQRLVLAPLIGLALLAGSLGCSTGEERRGDPWARGMGGALAARAGELLAAGEREPARQAALEALGYADRTSDQRTRGRAVAVLGELDRDPAQLVEARALLETHVPGPETWAVRLALADLLIDIGRLEEALAELGPVVTEAEQFPEPRVRAPAEASARRLRSAALRRLGRADEAHADDRRAALVLSLLPDEALPALRMALSQVLGDDLFARGDPAGAYARHTRARSLARSQGDAPAETRALAAQAHDLAAMGRFADAADRAVLTVEHARALGDAVLARTLALAGLGWCVDAGMPLDDTRRQPLVEALRQLDAELPAHD